MTASQTLALTLTLTLAIAALSATLIGCSSGPEEDPFAADAGPQEVLPELAAQRPLTDQDIRDADPNDLPPGLTVIRFEDVLGLGDLEWAWAIASDHGNIDEIRQVLDKGIDVDTLHGGNYSKTTRPNTGLYTTALIEAVRFERTEIIELLLEQGADPKIHERDYEDGVESGRGGDTALHKAVGKGNRDLVEKLLDLGVPVDAPGFDGWTPLSRAVAMDNPGLTKLLLERGGDPSAKIVGDIPLSQLFEDGENSAANLIHRAVRGEPLELPAEAGHQ